MTPDEMTQFEDETLHGEDERNRGDLGPASEPDEEWSPEEPVTMPTPIPNPD